MSRSRGLGYIVSAVLILALAPTQPLAAQTTSGAPLRLHLVPHVGLVTEPVVPDLRIHSAGVAAWTLGAQLEAVGRSRWTPLVGYQQWWLESTPAGGERRGWGAEAGLSYSLLPTSSFRPYGGAVLGVLRLGESRTYLQGRAGVDFTPAAAPVVLRMEARYQEFLAPGNAALLQLSTGIRFAIPSP